MEWILIGVLLLLMGKGKSITKPAEQALPASGQTPASGLEPKPSYTDRVIALKKRAAQGARWVDALKMAASSDFPEYYGWAVAVARWIGIESSGDPTNKTGAEWGLMQIDKTYAVSEKWITAEELDTYVSKKTSDHERALICWRYVKHLDAGHPMNWSDEERQWRAYMAHALPLLYRELADDNFLAEPNGPLPGGNMDHARDEYKPSDKVASYVKSGYSGGTTTRRVMARFVAPADVVAGIVREAWL